MPKNKFSTQILFDNGVGSHIQMERGGNGKMLKKFIQKHGEKICAMAVAFGGISLMSCRLFVYEPKQPDGLKEFMDSHAKKDA